MSHPLDEIIHFMKSCPVHEIETIFYSIGEIFKNFMKGIFFHEISSKI